MILPPKFNYESSELKILKTLSNSDTPMYLHEIAKKSGLSPQLTEYTLKKLVKEGVVVYKEDDKKYYDTHPCFKNKEHILKSFEPALKEIHDNLYKTDNAEKTLKNCMARFIEMFIITIE